MQVTAQRLAIMRSVASHPHATADDLADDVRSVIGTISRQAVYDTLRVLVDKQLIRRIQPAGSAARYENRVGDNHHHLICRECHAEVQIDHVALEKLFAELEAASGYRSIDSHVTFFGVCPKCQNQDGVITWPLENLGINDNVLSLN